METENISGVREGSRPKARKPIGATAPLLKFSQLKRHLVDELKTGRLGPGAAMPSEPRLAEKFNVSRPTVRRALAEMEDEGLIRREQGRGTFVNEGAQQQLRPRTGTFALLLSGKHDATALPLIHGFEEVCQSMRHNMYLCDSGNDINQQAELILRLLQSEIVGVAILPVTAPSTPYYHVATLQDRQVPVVFCHRRAEGAKGPLLAVPHEEEGRLVGRAFAKQGHRRVALVTGYRFDGITEKWTRGVRDSLQTVGGKLPEEFIYWPESTSINPAELEVELSKALERMLSSENPPTAIFAMHDVFAQAVYFELERMGYRVPEDISLVGLGDVDRRGAFLRRLSSVVIDGVDMGRRAVELLDEMQNGKRQILDSETFTIPIAMSDGQTLGPPPKSPVRYCCEDKKAIRI